MPINNAAPATSIVLDFPFVRECILNLRKRRTHRQFIGYICICEAAALAGRQEGLQPAFKKFFERFLLVGSAPEDAPYVMPFNDSGNPEANVWFNKNVAGSYAPSSIRSQAPLRRVVDVFGVARQATFSLKDGHEELCLRHLLLENRIDPVALAGFLFRDHAFILKDGETFTPKTLSEELFTLLGFNDGGFDRNFVFDEKNSEVAASFSYKHSEPS